MENDDHDVNPSKSWSHAVEKVTKSGYADGASDGQKAAFQTSFDMGFQQGIDFGFKIGFKQAFQSVQQNAANEIELTDRRMINCQICINSTTSLQNVGNLYNMQQEKNAELLKNCT